MADLVVWYEALATPFKVLIWVLAVFLILAIIKRLVKIAILVAVVILLIFAATFFLS